MKKLQWGIIGLGKIANDFVEDLQLLDNAVVGAVASRSESKAASFARKFGVSKYYGDYQSLFDDPAIDVVYIATPHDSHCEYTLAALRAGKHVLCEKPLGVNQRQVEQMIEVALENKVFLMEGLWTRFNPSVQDILKKIDKGVLGEVNYINADFSFYKEATPENRLLNMNLAGGSLLDVGIYPIFLAYTIMGMPEKIQSTARFHDTGADVQMATIFTYPNGVATLMSGIQSKSDMVARICGTKASISIQSRWHEAKGYELFYPPGGFFNRPKQFSYPTLGRGFTYEIQECIRCIEAGQLQSHQWTHQNSLDLIGIMDEIRGQIGLKYPFEK